MYFRIIDAQKVVCSSDPVRVIMLAFGTLFVNELIHRFIFGLVKNKYLSYLKKDFSESCGTTFGNVP